MNDLQRLIEQATERCDSINTMCSDQRRATKEVLTKLVADALVVDQRAFANDPPPPQRMATDITQEQANELQDILQTLTSSGVALITSARELAREYRSIKLIAETNDRLAWELVNLIDPEARGKSPLLLLKDLIAKLVADRTALRAELDNVACQIGNEGPHTIEHVIACGMVGKLTTIIGRAQYKNLRESLHWALDLIDMYDERLASIDGKELVYSPVHVAGKERARMVLGIPSKAVESTTTPVSDIPST